MSLQNWTKSFTNILKQWEYGNKIKERWNYLSWHFSLHLSSSTLFAYEKFRTLINFRVFSVFVMRKIFCALKNCFSIFTMQLIPSWKKEKNSLEKPEKCIINNMKIDFTWKVFRLLEFVEDEHKNQGTFICSAGKKFEASAIMFLSKKEKEMSSGEQSFHNLYDFFLPLLHQQKLQLEKLVLFRWHSEKGEKKDFRALWTKTQESVSEF